MSEQYPGGKPAREIGKSVGRIIAETDDDVLVGLVMRLTGGNANPAVVRGQIERIRNGE